MQLIDSSFFVGELSIPHLDTVGVSERLELFMKKYEKRFLTLLLGQSVYDAFMIGLEEDPVLAKWDTLRGKLVDNDTKESPIANFIYYHWMRDKITETVGLGESKAKAENSEIVNNDPKRVRAWNEMVEWVISYAPFFELNVGDYYSENGYYFRSYWCSFTGSWCYLDECGNRAENPFTIKNTLGI